LGHIALVQARTITVEINGIILSIQEKWREQEHLWPAALVLSKYLTNEATRPEPGSIIVEAGAGTGLVSMALGAVPASLGWSIFSTDCDHLALKNIRQNLGLNRLIGRVAVEQWDWYAPELPKWASTVDLVVASDVVYGNLCPSTAYFFLARRLAEILSPTSPCGIARRAGLPPPAAAGGAAAAGCPDDEANFGKLGDDDRVLKRQPPQALLLLQVRDGGYTGSTVEAFTLELERRGLRVILEPIPADALSAAPEENRAALRLLRVAAPRPPGDGAPPPTIDYGPRPQVEEPAAAPVAGDPLDELQWGEVGEP
jgi:hypothetical protein